MKKAFLKAEQENRTRAASDPNRLQYHLNPPAGWLNDPNGLCQKDGIYHIFYQYCPVTASGNGPKGWGHYSTPDFVHFREEEIPLLPDSEIDDGGAYSGSAFIDPKTGLIHFFYTGNGKIPGDYDYINEGRKHWVNHFTSEDGFHFSGKEVLLKNKDYPSDLSCHVRDPKIIEDHGHYYMVLGARTRDSRGQVNVFRSDDLKNWKPQSVISPETPFGYMWECPDLFDLEGYRILITCPQGVKQDGIDYENIYQNGYFILNGDLDHDQQAGRFTELDHGFDFYAPQSFEDEKGRRILIPWMGIPDADYDNDPTVANGWQHALGLPRELHIRDGHLFQFPIEETLKLRADKKQLLLKAGIPENLPSSVCEIELYPDGRDFDIRLRKDVRLFWKDQIFTLDLRKSGQGRTLRHVRISDLKKISVFSDTSSLEIFLNDGQESITTRVYDDQKNLQIVSDIDMKADIYELNGYQIEVKDQF